MAEVIHSFIAKSTTKKFIGIKYSDSDRDAKDTFGSKWEEWNKNGYFEEIKRENPQAEFDNSTYACMKMTEHELEYWIGLIVPAQATVPHRYDCLDLPAGDFGTCWFYGSHEKADIYFEQDKCEKALIEAGMNISANSFFFEKYVPERFTKDENGNVVLDFCILTPMS